MSGLLFKQQKERGDASLADETRGLIDAGVVGSSAQSIDVESSVMSVDAVVNALDWGPFQWLLLIQCGLSWACDAAEMMLLSFLVPKITPVLMPDASKATRDFYGFMLSAVTFTGIWIGALIFGKVSDKYGRRKGYLYSTAMVGLVGILCSFSPSMYVLIALRGIVGIGLGGVTCAVTLFSELVAEKYRGASIILSIGALWTFGCIFETCVAWFCFTLPGVQWRLFLVLSAIPSITLLTIFPWLVESPRFYMVVDKHDKALEVVKGAAAKNKVKLPENLRIQAPKKAAAAMAAGGVFRTLLGKRLRVTTVLLWGLWFSAVISYYGISFITPLYFSFNGHNEYVVTLLAGKFFFSSREVNPKRV